MITKLLLLLSISSVHPVVFAQALDELRKEDTENRPEPVDQGLITYNPTLRLHFDATKEINGKRLRVDGITYGIEQGMEIPSLYGEDSVDIEILDDDGRILDFQNRTIEKDMLRDFSIRRFFFQLGGGYRSTNRDSWNDLGIDPTGFFLSFSANYFPNKFGVSLGLLRQRDSGKDQSERLVEFSQTETQIGFGYEFVPYPASTKLQRLHLRLWLYYVRGQRELSVHEDLIRQTNGSTVKEDQVVSENSTDHGLSVAIEAMIPMTDRVWGTTRYMLTHRRLEFEKISFATERPVHDLLFGIYFAI